MDSLESYEQKTRAVCLQRNLLYLVGLDVLTSSCLELITAVIDVALEPVCNAVRIVFVQT